MRFGKERKAAPRQPQEREAPLGSRRLTVEWHNDAADYWYELEEYNHTFGSMKFCEPQWKRLATGTSDWAKRTSKHYKLDMPADGPAPDNGDMWPETPTTAARTPR